ncbi:AMP-binding protein [Pseudonocardia sp.]|jgi:phenylacetate-CoA ligase|uniref:phenylacetate--CoA ligase family protein n=1 Tax=Pseudonocardia sp. TaxID=60912 RepID=UPI002626423C|nr:AMP-binding protein [Pseudonocardia sp.]MCU1628128.1 putative Coenzyme ligase [Pseudonocardia sp.]MDT7702199.1 phenylacetate-CoA ligase [Pseudonocardiales bacterium]HEV7470425.1 AMP-binding protein [Pseudonocardia sp.]
MTTIDAHRLWNAPTQTAPRERLDALHLEKIRHLVGWAYEHSPLHRRIYDAAGVKPADIRTWDDYHHRLPFTDKPDYVADQEASADGFGGIALGPEQWQQYFHTTGTTGRFLNEAFTHYELHKAGSQYCYGLWDHGIRPSDSMYFCFDFGMWIGLWSFYWGARNLGLTIVSGGGASGVQRVRQIMERRPTVVCGTPTYLLHLAEIAKREGLDIRDAGVRMLAGGGEAGFSIPATRQQLREAWGAEQIYDAYGVGEALFIGQSCNEWAGGVHVVEDVCHSYSVDPASGEPVTSSDEVGEHVLTTYCHFAQPFIKYRTHDLVRIDDAPDHGCGWTWKHMPGVVLGRADFMVTIRGVNVYPTAVENLVGEVPGLSNHYELHISRVDGMDRMLVKVEAGAPGADVADLGTALGRHLRDHLGVRLETEVLDTGALPRYELKTKRIFDSRSAAERPVATLGGHP